MAEYNQKEKLFLGHIIRNRPKQQDLLLVGAADNIRVLDYYGERVYSLKDYKKWLKRQADFKKTGKLPHRLGG